MEIIERISQLCKENGISVSTLEKNLNYSNGSLAKAKDIPSSRILEIATKFNVSMEYLMTGKEVETFLTTEQQQIINAYNRADERTKKITELVLEPYFNK